MTAKPLRVGVIGANWGLNHIDAWRAVPGVEVAAICTSRRETAEAAARETDVPRPMWDAREMLADPTLDIIDVTPRPSIRAPLAQDGIQQEGVRFANRGQQAEKRGRDRHVGHPVDQG
jgi:predicted dehydrogenase